MNNQNDLKLLYIVQNIKIREGTFLNVSLYQKRNAVFYDVVLALGEKKIFLGRYNKTNDKDVRATYKDGKILIFYPDTIKENKQVIITEVLSLYDVADDTFYSYSEKEALELYDNSIDSSYLKNKKNVLHRTDVEKMKRL